jgi:manganese transport protein
VFGPGSLTVSSKLGALYGHSLLWVILVSTCLMMAFTSMGARIGLATSQSLLSTIKERWGRAAALFTGFGIFLVTASFQAGNSVGVGIAFAETFNTTPVPWIFFITICGISLLFFGSFYKVLEKAMIILVGLMLVSFLVTLLLARPNLLEVASGLLPVLPEGSLVLVVALVASSFSIAGAFYQSYLVQAKGWKRGDQKKVGRESFAGIFILGLISSMLLLSAGAILKPQGVVVNAASDMGKALEPLFGHWASRVFMLGLFGASFSSLLGNATIGGTMFADALGWGSHLNNKAVRGMIMLVMGLGASIAIVFGKLPLELIVFAQGVTIFVVPFIGLAIFLISNDKKLMGNLVNKTASKILGLIGLGVLLALAASNFYRLFF